MEVSNHFICHSSIILTEDKAFKLYSITLYHNHIVNEGLVSANRTYFLSKTHTHAIQSSVLGRTLSLVNLGDLVIHDRGEFNLVSYTDLFFFSVRDMLYNNF